MSPAVHHFVATLETGAVGNHIVEMQRLVRGLGHASEIFTEHRRGDIGTTGHHFTDYGRARRSRSDDILVYHTAIGSVVADFVVGCPQRLVVNHHNITPASYYAPWEPDVVHGINWGRDQLAAHARRATLGIGDSTYNAAELEALGYPATAVVPILIDLDHLTTPVDEATRSRLVDESGTGAAWLFVGRISPNKGHHDLLKAFSVYRRVFDPGAVLRVVGPCSSDSYLRALSDFAEAVQVDTAVSFIGPVSAGEVAAHYAAADVFVGLSDHEGFCVPLLEAMHHRLPIVAFGATAVPETLASAGLCLDDKAPTVVAAAANRVMSDPALRTTLTDAGVARLGDFALPVTRQRMTDVLAPLLSGSS